MAGCCNNHNKILSNHQSHWWICQTQRLVQFEKVQINSQQSANTCSYLFSSRLSALLPAPEANMVLNCGLTTAGNDRLLCHWRLWLRNDASLWGFGHISLQKKWSRENLWGARWCSGASVQRSPTKRESCSTGWVKIQRGGRRERERERASGPQTAPLRPDRNCKQ